jgi:hypothetical protein
MFNAKTFAMMVLANAAAIAVYNTVIKKVAGA